MNSTQMRDRILKVAGLTSALTLAGALGLPGFSASAFAKSKAPSTKNLAAELKTISKYAQSKGGTFKAVYTSTEGGQSQTITLEQAPPKSLFSTAGTEEIDTGSTTYICSSSGGGAPTCITESGASNPLASLATLFSPAGAIAAFHVAQSELSAKVAGYHLSFSNQTFAGVASQCVSTNYQGNAAKYCVAKNAGVLTYEGTKGQSFVIKSFSKSAPASDFSLPAGATTVTIPSAP